MQPPPLHGMGMERRLESGVRIVTPPSVKMDPGPSPTSTFDIFRDTRDRTSSISEDMMDMNTYNTVHGLFSPPTTGRSPTVPLPGQLPQQYAPQSSHTQHLPSSHSHHVPTMSISSVASSSHSIPASQTPSVGARAGLSDETIDELLLLYETFIHQHWPIIYLPALRSIRELETQSPLVFDAVLALCATNQDLGTVSGESSGEMRYVKGPMGVLAEKLVESVRQRVLNSLGQCDTATIQALILITLVDIGYGRMQFAYHMGGIACRMAIDLGLHTMRQPSNMPSPTPGRKEHEEIRTFWGCFILDKVLAALLQRPPMMRSVAVDTPRPSTMERDELDLWLAGSARQFLNPSMASIMECSKAHTLTCFNAWIDVMIILEEILDHVYRPSECRARIENPDIAGRRYDELVIGIDAALRAWRATLPPHLQWDDNDEHAHVCIGPHILTVRGWYYTCMVLVHRPRVPFLDAAASPLSDAAEALSRMSEPSHSNRPAHKRLPKGIDASRDAASNICQILEGYKHSFRVLKYPSQWVYMIFQAGTVHGGLAARPSPSPFANDGSHGAGEGRPGSGTGVGSLGFGLAPSRGDSYQRLEQCIRWLDQIAITWASASHHSEILRRISAVGAKTRPPSPTPRFDDLMTPGTQSSGVFDLVVDPGSSQSQSQPQPVHTETSQMGGARAMGPQQQHPVMDPTAQQSEELLNAWILFWAGMPTASDDLSLWQGFENMFTENSQLNANPSM